MRCAGIFQERLLDEVFDTSNTSNTNREVYADRGYPFEEREAWLKESGYRNQIQRKDQHKKRMARTRARVEHVFGAIEKKGGKLLRTIGQSRANFAMTMMAACYNLKRWVYLQETGTVAL